MLLALAACTDEVIDSAEPPATCEPLGMERVESWDVLDGGSPPAFGGNAGVGLGDVDGDGWLDALIVSPAGSIGLRNDGSGRLVEAWEVPDASGVALGDLDGDGSLEAWLGRRQGLNDLVWTPSGEVEIDDSDAESTTGSLADIDGDGDLDLFAARYAEVDVEAILDGTLEGSGNAIYLNSSGVLERDDTRLPAEVIDDMTFMGQWLDVEGDGDLDLYLANDFGPFLGRNRLLLNDGTGHFTLDDDCGCDLTHFGMGVAVGEANGDGRPDLFVTDLAGPDLLLSSPEGFYEASAATGAGIELAEDRLASWGTAFVDLDLDGDQDLPVIFGPLFPHGDPDGLVDLGEQYSDWIDNAEQRDALLLRDGEGFVEVAEDLGFDDEAMGRAVAVGDLDRDGRPDLVTAGLWYGTQWRTTGGCGGVTVKAPIGTRVEADGAVRWILPATTWSSSAHEIVLGLGEAHRFDEVRIGDEVFEDVPAGATLP